MATWNHDHGYHSENKTGNTHTALGGYMLASAFGLRAVPRWKLARGLVLLRLETRWLSYGAGETRMGAGRFHVGDEHFCRGWVPPSEDSE